MTAVCLRAVGTAATAPSVNAFWVCRLLLRQQPDLDRARRNVRSTDLPAALFGLLDPFKERTHQCDGIIKISFKQPMPTVQQVQFGIRQIA